ncbi:GGDEF domain-containing protein [Gracilibacillus kekensis]|uniref:Diguanylate cyclase (GGDEF) domain-containing protein n=1 Tax=Gracilibacillus kekensis TaxID=1027249 RepID=A0A1M7L441_9BACI|nr:GGDEF domain-containing protein [Gracilibacillus kekensis]SHM72860.1 diguanylate cyclase (GGDEF) domain-containing protein [Gracilibacillus kekensis]
MTQTRPNNPNDQLWAEKILYIYWIMVLMAFAGQVIGLITTIIYFPDYVMEFILKRLLLPTAIQIFILLTAHYVIKVKRVYSPKLIMFTGTIAAFVTVASHPTVPGLQIIFLLAMAVILIFFDKKKLRFSLYINIIALTSLYLFPSVRSSASEYEYFSYLFVLWAGYRVYLIVLERGSEVLDFLQRATDKEKELIVKSAMMERLSKIDALTNLYNHKTFHEYLDFLHEQSVSYDMPLQLALIDIDDFKLINDQFGHSNGDVVLKRVAQGLTDKLTENDVVARYGGEEFAVLLTNKSIEQALETMEEVRLYIAHQYHEELDGNITVSIGLKNLDKSMSKEALFKEADELLYSAKRNGKNQVMYDGKKESHVKML